MPKSESFVKIEGFATGDGAEDVQHACATHVEEKKVGSSMLTRELSLENMASSFGSTTWCPPGVPALEPMSRGRSSFKAPPSVPSSMLSQLQEIFPVFKEPLVSRAFNISRLSHDGNCDGPKKAPTFEKCIVAATILAELGADEIAVAGALLYDALDRTMLVESQLKPMLASEDTVGLVKDVSHLSYICQRFNSSSGPCCDLGDMAQGGVPECIGLVGLMVGHAPPRALLVRLGIALAEVKICASAVQDDRTLIHDEYIKSVAHEAMAVWAPLANRLGVWSVKAELEDLSFSCLLPLEHSILQKYLQKAQEPTALVGLVDGLRSALQKEDIDYIDLSGRPKHIWGVWCKMQKKGYSPDRVQDVRGLRVIVSTREECYRTLRAVETSWKVVGSSKNYIKDPKKNGYQSLHVIADPGDGHLVEIQIRTDKMHYLAEYGADAAHWKYKENNVSGHIDQKEEKESISSRELAREANWVKYEMLQHVAIDKKCRPSGSPSEDKSLETIMAGLRTKAQEEAHSSVSGSSKGRSFHDYIAASGQTVDRPEESRVLVAVISNGNFFVESLPQGSTLGDFLDTKAYSHGNVQVVVNRQVENDVSSQVRPGDVIELYQEPATVQKRGTTSPSKGNMLPLGNLGQKLSRTALA